MKNSLIATLLSPLTGLLMTPVLFIKIALAGLVLFCLWNLLLVCGADLPTASYSLSMFGALIVEIIKFLFSLGRRCYTPSWEALGYGTATLFTHASTLMWGLIIFKLWIL